MDASKLTLLESKIARLIEQFVVLKKQKSELERRVFALKNELHRQKEKAGDPAEQEHPAQALEQENRALREARAKVRSKVEGLLQKLEAMDLD